MSKIQVHVLQHQKLIGITYIDKLPWDCWARPHWQHEEWVQFHLEMMALPHCLSLTPLNYQQSASAEYASAVADQIPFSGKPFFFEPSKFNLQLSLTLPVKKDIEKKRLC